MSENISIFLGDENFNVSNQLEKQKLTSSEYNLKKWDKINICVEFLYSKGYITDGEQMKMADKLFTEIKNNVRSL